jgi:hypothetical protein
VKRTSSALRAGLLLTALLLCAAFLSAAAYRRLNFDELVTVRSGWLLVHGIDGLPSSPMPFNVFSGLLATALPDAGALFVVLRLLVAGGTLAALVWTFAAAGRWTVTLAALALTLLQAAFTVHGLEFRYEAAILLALVLGFGWLTRSRRGDFLFLGLAVSLLAAHHLKGAFFGVVLYGLALLKGRGVPGARPRLHAGLIAGLATWLAGAAALGFLPKVIAFYRMFAGLAASAPGRLWPWRALEPAFARDAAWWVAGGAALGWSVVLLIRRSGEERMASPDLPAVTLALASLVFLFLHPHPWAYMLAPAAPFVAFLMVRRFLEMSPPARAASLLAIFIGLLLQNAGPSPIGSMYWASFEAPRNKEVATLRLLRRVARPGEKVIDPSGLAYFLPPCRPDWYVDSLFLEATRQGRWMADLGSVSPSDCPWVVDTYRLEMLPEAARSLIGSEYLFIPGGLGLPRGDPRLSRPELWNDLALGRIDSFW